MPSSVARLQLRHRHKREQSMARKRGECGQNAGNIAGERGSSSTAYPLLFVCVCGCRFAAALSLSLSVCLSRRRRQQQRQLRLWQRCCCTSSSLAAAAAAASPASASLLLLHLSPANSLCSPRRRPPSPLVAPLFFSERPRATRSTTGMMEQAKRTVTSGRGAGSTTAGRS